jgi:hypothetical protein
MIGWMDGWIFSGWVAFLHAGHMMGVMCTTVYLWCHNHSFCIRSGLMAETFFSVACILVKEVWSYWLCFIAFFCLSTSNFRIVSFESVFPSIICWGTYQNKRKKRARNIWSKRLCGYYILSDDYTTKQIKKKLRNGLKNWIFTLSPSYSSSYIFGTKSTVLYSLQFSKIEKSTNLKMFYYYIISLFKALII